MTWARGIRRTLGLMLLISLVAWLTGCASTSKEPSVAATAEAREEALQAAFQEAVRAMEAGNVGAAEQQFRRLHEDNPDRTGPAANLGILAFESGELATATDYFKTVVSLDSNHVAALNYLGVIAREQGEFNIAEAKYRQALAADPDYLPAMMNLAILLDIYLRRPAEALPLYERYQAATGESHPRLKDWIFDVKNRM